jgi:DNA modification methylase
MVHSAITLGQVRSREALEGQSYWSLLHGEFPWCLDDSEHTDAPSELIGCFDLILADPPRMKRMNGTRMRTPLDRCQPDTDWLEYCELFLRERGSLLVFSPIESIGAYIRAVAKAGLDYCATYIWNNPESSISDAKLPSQSVEAILWAAKAVPHIKPCLPNNLISAPYTSEGKQRIIEQIIDAFTEPEMAILEPFTVDSLTLATCQKMHRYCLAIAKKRSHIKQIRYTMMDALRQTA